jgi:hypothetical protein
MTIKQPPQPMLHPRQPPDFAGGGVAVVVGGAGAEAGGGTAIAAEL